MTLDQKLQEQFNQVLEYSQGYDTHYHTDQLFAAWREHKQRFLDSMGGPIYEMEQPVTFELDYAARLEKVDEFIEWVGRSYGDRMWNFFKQNYDGILENKLVYPCGDFPSGMKLSKVLMKEFGLEAEDVRQKLAMLIQSNKINGKLCLSVHPLDYLSASENTHGWRSCHALDGEYRAGNLSYMVDNVTIMAYLKSESDSVLPRFPFPWSDKKWRCYFYCDQNNKVVYAGRQYPFHSNTALEYVTQLLKKFQFFDPDYTGRIDWYNGRIVHFIHAGIRGNTNINDTTCYFNSTKVICGNTDEERRIVPMKHFVTTHPEAFCFNDLIDSHVYAPWILTYDSYNEYLPTSVSQKLIVGAPFNCLRCNEALPCDSDTFFCESCRDHLNGDDEDKHPWD